MRKLKLLLPFALACLLVCILSPAFLFAQNEEPKIDPFKVLIKPKNPPREIKVKKPDLDSIKPPPPIPELKINITAIAGKPSNYVAIIKHEGKAYIVEEGFQSPDSSFKVRKVYRDKLEVFYKKTGAIKTFLFD